jgi:hypothetical protein
VNGTFRALAAVALLGATAAAPVHGSACPATPLSELVVPGGPAPKVASSYPAEGAVVPAGVLVLKIVFDQPMTAGAWSYGQAGTAAFPSCLGRPRLLADQRTFVLLCSVAPSRAYAIEVNPGKDFASAQGRLAAPRVLHFSTTDADTRYLHDALADAGLTDADDPIMSWREDGTGVSASSSPNPNAKP